MLRSKHNKCYDPVGKTNFSYRQKSVETYAKVLWESEAVLLKRRQHKFTSYSLCKKGQHEFVNFKLGNLHQWFILFFHVGSITQIFKISTQIIHASLLRNKHETMRVLQIFFPSTLFTDMGIASIVDQNRHESFSQCPIQSVYF